MSGILKLQVLRNPEETETEDAPISTLSYFNCSTAE
jgi:hypothetical protein